MPDEGHEHPGPWLTKQEAARYTRTSLRTFERWLAPGLLPYHRPAGGRRLLLHKGGLEELIGITRADPRDASRGRTGLTNHATRDEISE